MSTPSVSERGVAAVVVLAAGAGTRMKSQTSKLLHRVAGRSLVSCAVDAARAVHPEHLVVVVGHQREQVQQHLAEVAPDVTIAVQAKVPGPRMVTQEINLNVDFSKALGQRREAYERLLDDAMSGARHRFAREDTINEEWRIVDELLDRDKRPVPYYKKTWGPGIAQTIPGPSGWFDVTVKS